MLTENDMQQGLLADADIGRILGIPARTVRWWRLSGKLRYLRCGRHPRVLRRDLDAFLAARASDAVAVTTAEVLTAAQTGESK